MEEILASICLKYQGYTMRSLLKEPLVLIEYLYRMSEWKTEYDTYNALFVETVKSGNR